MRWRNIQQTDETEGKGKIMKRLLAAWMLLVQLALCWTIGLAEDAFEKETYYIHNDEMNRSIYAVQIKPKD